MSATAKHPEMDKGSRFGREAPPDPGTDEPGTTGADAATPATGADPPPTPLPVAAPAKALYAAGRAHTASGTASAGMIRKAGRRNFGRTKPEADL